MTSKVKRYSSPSTMKATEESSSKISFRRCQDSKVIVPGELCDRKTVTRSGRVTSMGCLIIWLSITYKSTVMLYSIVLRVVKSPTTHTLVGFSLVIASFKTLIVRSDEPKINCPRGCFNLVLTFSLI